MGKKASVLSSSHPYVRWINRQPVGVRILIFLGLLGLGWGPFAVVIYGLGAQLGATNTASTLALVLLYAWFIVLLRGWGRSVHQWQRPIRYCGLTLSPAFWKQIGGAICLGFFSVLTLFGIEMLLGWAIPQPLSSYVLTALLEGGVVALAFGFAEELLLRGWLLTELEHDLKPMPALLINSSIFAVAHFIKPLSEIIRTAPQFIGLFILGMALVWAKRSSDRPSPILKPSGTANSLGLPIGLHAGLIWGYYVMNVGGLVQYSGQVPAWVTGIDENPLAGALGIIMLASIALFFAKRSQGN